tara:strand:+ start:254 stop:1138 length:885 start_codon:yes stop_codon:yes gene_type:complete
MTETQTYTFDTSDDPVSIEQAEQRDAETLEIGEKMMAEQENLLAGKYKTTEDLESAYKELEAKLGSQESEESEESEAEEDYVQLDPKDYYLEDGSVNYEAAKEAYGDQLTDVFEASNIDPFEMNTYFYENNGTLSDDMYSKLAEAGLPKGVVDNYLDGVRQSTATLESTQPPIENFSQQDVDDVRSIAGGAEGYDALMEWAADNLNEVDADNFDQVLDTGNKAAISFAIKALMSQYEEAAGRDSDLIQGKKAAAPEGYRSMAEVVRDMNNPAYETDDAYRDDVRRKLQSSNLKL